MKKNRMKKIISSNIKVPVPTKGDIKVFNYNIDILKYLLVSENI